MARRTLDDLIGDTETDLHQQKLYYEVFKHTYDLILVYTESRCFFYSFAIFDAVL